MRNLAHAIRYRLGIGTRSVLRRPNRTARRERGATAVEYALMVGLLSIGIITAVVSMKDNVRTVLSTAGGEVYSGQANGGGASFNVIFVAGSGSAVTGSYQDTAYQGRDSTISGTKTASALTFIRTHKPSVASGCRQQFIGTSTDNGVTYTGSWAETGGPCGGSGTFSIKAVGF